MTHRSELVQTVIIGLVLLVTTLLALFALKGGPEGKATTASTVEIVNSTPRNCTFDVQTGYNLISLPCLSTAVPLADIIPGDGLDAMYQYVPGTTDPWKVYKTGLPTYVRNDLEFATRRAGYIVYMTQPANRTIEGLEISLTSIPLVPGYNLVGYPSFDIKNMTDSTSSIAGSFTTIIAFDRTTQAFVMYPGTLNQTAPGNGYWINATTTTNWAVTS